MENLRFVIAAGETKTFERGGRYLEIIEAAGPIGINLYDAAGGRADGAKNILSGTYMESPFSKFEVFSATAQTVELFLTDTRGGTRRQPGNVRIIDNSADKTAAGSQFLGSVSLAAAGAGVFSIAGIKAGTRRISIRSITINSASPGLIFFGTSTGQLTVAYSDNGVTPNKNMGSAASSANRYTANSAAMPPTPAELGGTRTTHGFKAVPASTETVILSATDAPILINAGASFWIAPGVANRDISATFDFEEL